MVVVLTAAGLFAGGVLAYVYRATSADIEANRVAEKERAVGVVVPGTVEKRYDESSAVYECLDGSGRVVGYAFEAVGSGFQGPIGLMIGADADLLTLTGLYVLESSETPGLGAKISTDEFRGQFAGLSVADGLTVVKNEPADKARGRVQAITGATISSNAVGRIVNLRLAEVRGALKGGSE